MAVFLPGYQWVTNARNGGGTYANDGPPRILLHMTVSMGISASYISGHPYPPHLWANPYNGDRFQTVSLDRSAFALYQPDYGNSWTNKQGFCLQTEVIGVPQVSVATWTDDQCRWIGEQVVAPQAVWLASIGRPVNLSQVKYHQNTSGSASENWPGRMGEAEWDSFNGLCAHIDVPYNDHWDASAERMDRIADYARAALGGTGSPIEGELTLAQIDDIYERLGRIEQREGFVVAVVGAVDRPDQPAIACAPGLWRKLTEEERVALVNAGLAPDRVAFLNGRQVDLLGTICTQPFLI